LSERGSLPSAEAKFSLQGTAVNPALTGDVLGQRGLQGISGAHQGLASLSGVAGRGDFRRLFPSLSGQGDSAAVRDLEFLLHQQSVVSFAGAQQE
jgi:hypothetical protein